MASSKERLFAGTVVSRRVGGTSKSARQAVVLQSEDGDYTLRRAGGNPFHDPELVGLVGRRITARGVTDGSTLTVSSWTVSD